MDTLSLILTLVGALVLGVLGYRGGAWLARRRGGDAGQRSADDVRSERDGKDGVRSMGDE